MTALKKKKRSKRGLIIAAIIIIGASLWYTNYLVSIMARDERKNVEVWAESIHQKADLVSNTEVFFEQLRNDERRKVELLAEATKRFVTAETSEDISFFSEIISSNMTIPVVLTEKDGKITSARNQDFDTDSVEYLQGELKEEFTKYPPIVFDYYTGKIGGNTRSRDVNYYYYKDSKTFSDLQIYLDELINSFFSEVVANSASVPVIITDSSKTKVIASGNVDPKYLNDSLAISEMIHIMEDENTPMQINFTDYGTSYIFYRDSYTLRQFRYLPFVQFGVIGLFIFLGYMIFSASRRSEQNQVWAGMAKETAHQLGTPLSSLMAWIEMLKMKDVDESIIVEMEKDIFRLNNVSQRFSKIGSKVNLKEENIIPIIDEAIQYLKNRTSRKVDYVMTFDRHGVMPLPINKHLFQWVIENLCKNAVDAMNGVGKITIDLEESGKWILIDITDTGKGIDRDKLANIFNPGFTTKKRGWGLGLTLAQRIINFYHKGKIFVKDTTPGKGTTFRIQLRKSKP